MTDPNSDTTESADSKQDAEQTQLPSSQTEQGQPSASTADRSSEVPAAGTGGIKAKPHHAKKGHSKGKPKKGAERKAAVSEKFSRSDSRGFQLTTDGLLRHFLACRVCCYFLSGVQVLYGRQVVDRMVREFDGTWMYVPLTRETRTLLQKTYGVQVDTGDFFIEHACEVCCRRFVIDLPEPEDFVANENEEADLEEPERREPTIFEEARTREEREPDWGQDRPMMLVEFKHRR